MFRSFFLGLLMLLLLAGCDKAVTFELEDASPRLVVEATIENGQPPRVILSRSLGYFSAISPDLLANSFVHDAEITVSNGSRIHRLKEYALPAGNGYTLYYYSIDSSNPATAFLGELKTSYHLRILSEGTEYTATTTIRDTTKRIDSVWWKPAPPPADPNQVVIYVRATDPPGFGDYIRYFTGRNRQPFFPALNATFDDLFVDGTTYELQLEPGLDRNREREEEDNFFVRGDTVRMKLGNIDRATYDFWRTMEFSYASIGNPFSSPVKVLSNIQGPALGYFGGYAVQYRTLVIPK